MTNKCKIFVLLTILCGVSFIHAQEMTKQPLVVYSLPKTELTFVVEVEKVSQKPGPFFQFSERFLGASKVIQEEKVNYNLKSITIERHAVPDLSRTFTMPFHQCKSYAQISLTRSGILCGINVPIKENSIQPELNRTENLGLRTVDVLPLGEEHLMAGSSMKLAEGIAKQIYRIRESRLSLLTADLEHLPADGASLKTMLAELNKTEKELTELFVGKTTIETIRESITMVPSDTLVSRQVLFRLSSIKGLVPSHDLSGAPFYLNIIPKGLPNVPKLEKVNKSSFVLNTLIPMGCMLTIDDGINVVHNQRVELPQMGVIIPVIMNRPLDTRISIDVDPLTGRLLNIKN